MSRPMTIESLPAKWREGIALLRQHETPQEVLDTFEQCADELEAALATQPKDEDLLAFLREFEHAVQNGVMDDGDGDGPMFYATQEWALNMLETLRTIATQPKDVELLALADRMTSVARAIPGRADDPTQVESWIARWAIELRTLASRPAAELLPARTSPLEVVMVDDAMVERAIRAGCAACPSEYQPNGPDGFSDAELAIGHTFMRAALTAALQPDSGEVWNG